MGWLPLPPHLDQIGPITKDVEDCAIMMNAISGYDPYDSTSVNIEVPDYKTFSHQGCQRDSDWNPGGVFC